LSLNSNPLSGDISTDLQNLTTLFNSAGLDIRWNVLHSDDATLIAFLNSIQRSVDWQSSQTDAPTYRTIGDSGDHTVWLTWDLVSYQSDPGGYEVFSAPTETGIWASGGWTEAKTDIAYQ
jgi:hypothetical protein